MINRNPQQRGQSLFSNAMEWPTQPSCIFVVSRNKLPRNCVAIIVLFVRCNATLIPSYGFAGIVKLATLSAQEELWSPHNATIIIARASSSGHKLYLFTVKELLFIFFYTDDNDDSPACVTIDSRASLIWARFFAVVVVVVIIQYCSSLIDWLGLSVALATLFINHPDSVLSTS